MISQMENLVEIHPDVRKISSLVGKLTLYPEKFTSHTYRRVSNAIQCGFIDTRSGMPFSIYRALTQGSNSIFMWRSITEGIYSTYIEYPPANRGGKNVATFSEELEAAFALCNTTKLEQARNRVVHVGERSLLYTVLSGSNNDLAKTVVSKYAPIKERRPLDEYITKFEKREPIELSFNTGEPT